MARDAERKYRPRQNGERVHGIFKTMEKGISQRRKSMKYAIEIENLTKNYGKHRGVENVDLCVKEGEWFGFIGPNGAGKSTTIRTLLGLIKPTKGESRVFGLYSWK